MLHLRLVALPAAGGRRVGIVGDDLGTIDDVRDSVDERAVTSRDVAVVAPDGRPIIEWLT